MECLADAEMRERRRIRESERRALMDKEYVREYGELLMRPFEGVFTTTEVPFDEPHYAPLERSEPDSYILSIRNQLRLINPILTPGRCTRARFYSYLIKVGLTDNKYTVAQTPERPLHSSSSAFTFIFLKVFIV
jgi:hypothetical protein